MKRTIFIIFSLFISMTIAPLFAQETEQPSQAESSSSESSSDDSSAEAFAIIPELECEESSDIDARRTKVTFNANVPNCLVYLNGNLQGRTKLSLINLVDGIYLLRVAKDGYEFKENFITVDAGKAKTFYVELEPNAETQKKLETRAQAAEQAKAQQTATTDNAQTEQNASTSDSEQAAVGDNAQ